MLALEWHKYKYYPYEQVLAVREIERLIGSTVVTLSKGGVSVESPADTSNAARLVYFASLTDHSGSTLPTQQALLERANGTAAGRQATRYSSHGLHEYKGKFNPQIAKALLNMFGAEPGNWVLDPFCGSGTSLVEAAHLGINAVGTDINPLAVFLANAKVQALSVPAESIQIAAQQVIALVKSRPTVSVGTDARTEYLRAWFPADVLGIIENLREAIEASPAHVRDILLAIASNLLRDYSLQEPSDLRIRRRTSPFPEATYLEAFENAVAGFIKKLRESQAVLGLLDTNAKAQRLDCRESLIATRTSAPEGFDMALTSPPYATALPYIDTQRLSLVWLGLLAPSDILMLESQLVGSREIRGTGKGELLDALIKNDAGLPEVEIGLCVELQRTLTEMDGFRRQAVPRLLYRYFAGMADSFASVRRVMKRGGMYGLIVGGNHTVLSGKRFDIDTPAHLSNLAVSRGWTHVETIELQTYKRYGLHSKNAGTTESLIVLQAS